MVNYDMLTNEELLKRISGRDRGVIAFVYDKYAPALYGIILENTPSKKEAGSILYNTFITFFNTPDLPFSRTRSIFIQLRNASFIALKKQPVLSVSRLQAPIGFPNAFKVNTQP